MTALTIHECASKLYKCFYHSQQQKAMIIRKTYEFLAFPYQEAEKNKKYSSKVSVFDILFIDDGDVMMKQT